MPETLEGLIVVSKTREMIKKYGEEKVRVSEEFLDSLNAEVHNIIKKGIERVKGNDRATLKGVDV